MYKILKLILKFIFYYPTKISNIRVFVVLVFNRKKYTNLRAEAFSRREKKKKAPLLKKCMVMSFIRTKNEEEEEENTKKMKRSFNK